MRWLLLLILLILSLGCKKSGGDVVGNWSMTGPLGLMQLEFKSDGTYGGKYMGAGVPADMSGTHKLDGKILQMDAPTLSVIGQSSSLGGGAMRMSMQWQGKDMVLLDNGTQKFTMTRTGPPAK